MIFRTVLNRFNVEHKPVTFDSREYGYLVLILEYINESDNQKIVPPIKIRFVPDPKLSVNQLMEFKKLHTDMRLYLSHNGPDGCLRLILRDSRLYFSICHGTSEMEVPIEKEYFSAIQEILDDLSIIISTNTFFQLDLKEVQATAGRHMNEWKGYLMNFFPH